MKHTPDFSTTVCGIPCGVVIESFTDVEHDFTSWASPDDYYGYTDSEWFIVDRKGYNAKWLTDKMTEDDHNEVNSEVVKHCRKQAQNAKEDYYG